MGPPRVEMSLIHTTRLTTACQGPCHFVIASRDGGYPSCPLFPSRFVWPYSAPDVPTSLSVSGSMRREAAKYGHLAITPILIRLGRSGSVVELGNELLKNEQIPRDNRSRLRRTTSGIPHFSSEILTLGRKGDRTAERFTGIGTVLAELQPHLFARAS